MNLKPPRKGNGTKLAGVIARNVLWSLTIGAILLSFFTIGKHGQGKPEPRTEKSGFIDAILTRLPQNHPPVLNGNYLFDLDTLPVQFGSVRVTETVGGSEHDVDRGTYPRSEMNGAMRDLTDLIWKRGGFRFTHMGTNFQSCTYQYHCSQDLMRAKSYRPMVEVGKQRDGRRMTRFPCQSKLTIRPCLQNRTMSLSIHHQWHAPYEDIELSPVVQVLINSLVSTKTPSEIYREIRQIPEGKPVTRHQVYYLWQKANAEIWQRDLDPFISATMLLSENSHYRDHHDIFTAGNLRALGFFASEPIQKLRNTAPQLVMDSTFGTNSGGMDLFAVLAEVEGTDVPLAYCLVELLKPPQANLAEGKPVRADPGVMTYIIQQFLERLKIFGFNPRCVALDKDPSELAAVTTVWPGVKVQLCYWHVKRAVGTKLNSSKSTNTQNHYRPEEAQKLIPDLEICWGSLPVRRPVSHRFGDCSCPSKGEKISEMGRLEPATKEDRDTVLEIFCRHFNLHPLIPDSNGTYKCSTTLHRECAAEIHTWCKARGYYRLWAYLYVNWYCPNQWKLWARAADSTEIPVVKTTMIVESHWRTLKHDYLHRFNRPRVDLVVWVLASRVLPDAIHRMKAISSGQFRIFKARWREAFKKQWRREASKTVDPDKLKEYHTSPVNWVCSCKSFLHSRFLICKHIVHCFESPSPDFFETVSRQTVYPFWKDERLVLLPEFASREGLRTRKLHGNIEMQDTTLASPLDSSGSESEQDEEDDQEAVPLEIQVAEFRTVMQEAIEIFEDQVAKGNEKFVERFIASNQINRTLVEEVKHRRNMRSMPRTWGRCKHPATMYFK
ncbi:ATP-dependent DNA helicase PIF1 [Penicillium canescens]|nr:ATP-dependent DNA helicase PIF1 [Penicillium canescens]KAJ6175205.1 ATP-dependent DNA helicase PIF1 [Penicillium canescens]